MPIRDYLYPLSDEVTALVVMATPHEYGEHLKGLRVTPFITGVGPVKAATSLTYALCALGPQRPDIILNLGSAGSATLDMGAVYRVSETRYRDMDAEAFGFIKGQTPFSPHPPIIKMVPLLKDLPSATCSTGADVVSDHTKTGTDMAEMEYSALNEVAMGFGMALMGFKGISDGQAPLNGTLMDWTQLLPIIDQNLARVVTYLKTELMTGHITKADLCAMPPHWHREHILYHKEL
jgi:adenosylhomocysteine nucleosidase